MMNNNCNKSNCEAKAHLEMVFNIKLPKEGNTHVCKSKTPQHMTKSHLTFLFPLGIQKHKHPHSFGAGCRDTSTAGHVEWNSS